MFSLFGPDPPMSQTDRQTDRETDEQTICDCKTVLCTIVHRVVKNMEIGKKEKSTEAWKEYKKSRQNANRVISLVKLYADMTWL